MLLINSRSKKEAWILTVSLCLLLSHILIINSRASLLALIVFLIAILITSNQLYYFKERLLLFNKKHKILILLLFFIPLIINIVPGTSAGGLSWKKNEKSFADTPHAPSSSSIRFNAYLTAFDMIQDKPVLGVGLGNFHISFRSYARSQNSNHKVTRDLVYLHNELLQTFVELGVIGGGIFILIIGNTLFFTFYFVKGGSNPPFSYKQSTEKIFALGLLFALISSSVHGLLSFPLHQATSGFMYYLWFGLLTGLLSYQVKINQKVIPVLKTVIIFIFLTMIYIFNHYKNYIKSNYYINSAMLAFNDTNCTKAIEQVDKSFKYYAKDYYPQSWAISIYAGCKITDINKKLYLVEKILANNPLHPWALKMAAITYFKQGNYKYAEQALQLIANLYPSLPAPQIELGNVLYKQHKYIEAQNYYSKALILAPQHPLALKMLNKTQIKIRNMHPK